MKLYKNEITLNRNSRGCYILDTVKGCETCLSIYPNGCYEECYANNIAKRYGFDFSKSINRSFKEDKKQMYFFGFKDDRHIGDIKKKIIKCNMPFIRIGEMGDPSEDWGHTVSVCKEISDTGKFIVIVTKHWKIMNDNLLKEIKNINICINTSISALDNRLQISHRLNQFHRLKPYCKSVLRIVSCDFNKNNYEGLAKSILQDKIFTNRPNIDTALRLSSKNKFFVKGIINAERTKFLSKNILISKFNKDVYIGNCDGCPDMCGINF